MSECFVLISVYFQLVIHSLILSSVFIRIRLPLLAVDSYVLILHRIASFRLGAKDCWSGACSSEIFKKLPAFLQISLVGLAGTFMEWTSIEATLFLAVSVCLG